MNTVVESVSVNSEFNMTSVICIPTYSLQDMCKMATEAISSGQTSVQAELRRTANTRKCLHLTSFLWGKTVDHNLKRFIFKLRFRVTATSQSRAIKQQCSSTIQLHCFIRVRQPCDLFVSPARSNVNQELYNNILCLQ